MINSRISQITLVQILSIITIAACRRVSESLDKRTGTMKKYLSSLLLGLAIGVSVLPAWAGMTKDDAQAHVAASAIHQRLVAMGIDPDSEQGKASTRWFERFAQEPAWQAQKDPASGLVQLSNFGSFMQRASAEQRLRLFDATFALLQQMGGQCQWPQGDQWAGNPHMLGMLLVHASVDSIDRWMSALDSVAKVGRTSAQSTERYTTPELLQADSYISEHLIAALKKRKDMQAMLASNGANPPPNIMCTVAATLVQVVDAAPDDIRARVTWEMLTGPQHAALGINGVLTDPLRYALEAFDQAALPEGMRARLPSPGSLPLPFKSIVVRGSWDDQATKEVEPFMLTFLNTQNSGVIIQITQALPSGHAWKFARIETDLGVLTLKTQDLSAEVKMPEPALIPASDYKRIAHTAPDPDGHYDYPIAVPDMGHDTAQHCDSADSYPASHYWPTLTGQALEFNCQMLAGTKVTESNRYIYLKDYGIEIPLFSVGDDGLNFDHIDSITVQQ